MEDFEDVISYLYVAIINKLCHLDLIYEYTIYDVIPKGPE